MSKEKPVIKLTLADDQIAELKQKVHILNEGNMDLENAIASQADYFRQQISVLESQLEQANAIIKSLKDARSPSVDEYLEKWCVK